MQLRVEQQFNVVLPAFAPGGPLPTIPPITWAFPPTQIQDQLKEVMEGVAKAMIDWMVPVRQAVETVHARSADWTTPYARQLRDEVGRLRSRLARLS
jgi:hypothetical protein